VFVGALDVEFVELAAGGGTMVSAAHLGHFAFFPENLASTRNWVEQAPQRQITSIGFNPEDNRSNQKFFEKRWQEKE
jgi:hypothetical protein